MTDDGLLDLDRLNDLLTERTKLLAVTAVSNVLGTINPIAELIRAARRRGTIVLVDRAQSVPHLKTNVQALNVDFLVFSGHKMLGPSGVGVLYGKRALLDAMPPFLGGGSMIQRVALDNFEPADTPQKFEAGTPPIVSAIGLGAAIDYLAAVISDASARHERLLTRRAHEVLQAVAGVRIFGAEPSRKAGIVSFTLDGVHARDVRRGPRPPRDCGFRPAMHTAMPLHARYGVSATGQGELLFLQHAGRGRAARSALEDAQADFHRRRRWWNSHFRPMKMGLGAFSAPSTPRNGLHRRNTNRSPAASPLRPKAPGNSRRKWAYPLPAGRW